jgi:hypothetical protein
MGDEQPRPRKNAFQLALIDRLIPEDAAIDGGERPIDEFGCCWYHAPAITSFPYAIVSLR